MKRFDYKCLYKKQGRGIRLETKNKLTVQKSSIIKRIRGRGMSEIIDSTVEKNLILFGTWTLGDPD